MKTCKILGISLVAFMVLACQAEPLDEPASNQVKLTFHAGFAEQNGTKTMLDEDGTSIWWSPEDSISVFYGTLASAKFTATNTEPAALTTFEGTFDVTSDSIEADSSPDIWAVYPYSPDDAFDGNSVTLSVPAEQLAVAGTFAPGMFPAISRADSYDLPFYNVCGGIVFSVVNEDIMYVELKSNNGEPLAGEVKVAFDADGYPAVQEVIDGYSTIAVFVNEDEGFIPGEKYFISVLPGTLQKGLSLVFHKPFAENTLEKTESITINRSLFKKALEADQGMAFEDSVAFISFSRPGSFPI